jgi:hypothetical protein
MTLNPKSRSADALDFPLGSLSPGEKAFIEKAEQIAREVAAMSSDEVANYIADHNLQHLVAPERIEAILAKAIENAERRDRKQPAPTLTIKRV